MPGSIAALRAVNLGSRASRATASRTARSTASWPPSRSWRRASTRRAHTAPPPRATPPVSSNRSSTRARSPARPASRSQPRLPRRDDPMSLSDIVDVDITRVSGAVTQESFSTPLILAYHTRWTSDRVRPTPRSRRWRTTGSPRRHGLQDRIRDLVAAQPARDGEGRAPRQRLHADRPAHARGRELRALHRGARRAGGDVHQRRHGHRRGDLHGPGRRARGSRGRGRDPRHGRRLRRHRRRSRARASTASWATGRSRPRGASRSSCRRTRTGTRPRRSSPGRTPTGTRSPRTSRSRTAATPRSPRPSSSRGSRASRSPRRAARGHLHRGRGRADDRGRRHHARHAHGPTGLSSASRSPRGPDRRGPHLEPRARGGPHCDPRRGRRLLRAAPRLELLGGDPRPAAIVEAASTKKLLVAQSADTACLDADSITDVMYSASDADYFRTAIIYHPTIGLNFAAAAGSATPSRMRRARSRGSSASSSGSPATRSRAPSVRRSWRRTGTSSRPSRAAPSPATARWRAASGST